MTLADLVGQRETIGHQVLDLEIEFTHIPLYEQLDILLQEAIARIPVKQDRTKEEAITVLRTIDDVLRGSGFKFENNLRLFNEALETKEINCHDAVYIYLSVAQALSLPLVEVDVPGHSFVRWKLGQRQYFNWETGTAQERSNEEYIAQYNIPPKSISDGIFLRDLTSKEVIGGAISVRGLAHSRLGKDHEAIEDFNRAIELYPTGPVSYCNRGNAWYREGNLYMAIRDFNTAIDLNPNFSEAYNSRANAFRMKGMLDEALEDANKAIELVKKTHPIHSLYYYGRGLILSKKGEDDGAIQDFTTAIDLTPNNPNPYVYYERGKSRSKLNDKDGAIEDYRKAIELNPNFSRA